MGMQIRKTEKLPDEIYDIELLDLLRPEVFNTVAVVPRKNESSTKTDTHGPRDFDIQISTDGKKYTTIKSIKDYTPYNEDGNYDIHLDESVTARYIRFYITKAYDDLNQPRPRNVQIREIMVYNIIQHKINITAQTTFNNDQCTLTVVIDNDSGIEHIATAIIAVYDTKNKLVDLHINKDVQVQGTLEIVEELGSVSEGDKIKVMLWEKLEDGKSLCESEEITLNI